MIKENSVAKTVSTHIITTAIVIPFFGFFPGYIINKYLGNSLNEDIIMVIQDIFYILFFFFGVKYSISYMKKNIIVKNPTQSLKYSIITFGTLIFILWLLNTLSGKRVLETVYDTVFCGIIFTIFFVFTKKFFGSIKKDKGQ